MGYRQYVSNIFWLIPYQPEYRPDSKICSETPLVGRHAPSKPPLRETDGARSLSSCRADDDDEKQQQQRQRQHQQQRQHQKQKYRTRHPPPATRHPPPATSSLALSHGAKEALPRAYRPTSTFSGMKRWVSENPGSAPSFFFLGKKKKPQYLPTAWHAPSDKSFCESCTCGCLGCNGVRDCSFSKLQQPRHRPERGWRPGDLS